MLILASDAFISENKKIQEQNITASDDWTQASDSPPTLSFLN